MIGCGESNKESDKQRRQDYGDHLRRELDCYLKIGKWLQRPVFRKQRSVCMLISFTSNSGSERSPREENGNLLQNSFLGNPMDSGSWLATVHEATKESDMTSPLNKNNKTLL